MSDKPYYQQHHLTIYNGDNRKVLPTLPDCSVQTCVTSPPYFGLRDYGVDGQIGLEQTPDAYVAELVAVFREVRRVLRDDGTLWLNLGDSYASAWACSRRNTIGNGSLENGKREARPNRLVGGLKEKDLIGIPWAVAIALRADGWFLRQDIIWHKPNPMPESVTDRCTKAHEYIFLLAKSERYFYHAEAVAEPVADSEDPKHQTKSGNVYHGKRNRRSVWTCTTKPFPGAHFATFPPDLIKPCIAASTKANSVVLDPFFGAGTTGVVCADHAVACIGIELNQAYCDLAIRRLSQGVLFGASA